MEDARALLDSLMGHTRDKTKEENSKTDGWKESGVCKRYLLGFCPNSAQDNWFHNTRRKDIGMCHKIHSDRLREDFENHPDRGKYEPDYEREFLRFLEDLVREADQWIQRETANSKSGGKVTKMPEAVKEKLAQLKNQSEILFKHAEDASEKGDISASKCSTDLAEIINKEMAELREEHTYESAGDEVCDVCGVRCNPEQKADFQGHLGGRVHEAYTKIREKVKILREKARNPAAKNESGDGKDKRDRERDRKGSKNEESKEEAKPRDRDRDRERRDRDRDRKRSRSRDRRR